MQVERRDGSVSVGWAVDRPWRNHWCPRWRSCEPPRERRWPEHRQPCTRLKSITIHLASPTIIACETQERKREKETCECGLWMICIMFLKGGWQGKEGSISGPSSWFLPRRCKAIPSWSLNRDHHHRHYRLSDESTKLRDRCPNSTKNFYVILSD